MLSLATRQSLHWSPRPSDLTQPTVLHQDLRFEGFQRKRQAMVFGLDCRVEHSVTGAKNYPEPSFSHGQAVDRFFDRGTAKIERRELRAA